MENQCGQSWTCRNISKCFFVVLEPQRILLRAARGGNQICICAHTDRDALAAPDQLREFIRFHRGGRVVNTESLRQQVRRFQGHLIVWRLYGRRGLPPCMLLHDSLDVRSAVVQRAGVTRAMIQECTGLPRDLIQMIFVFSYGRVPAIGLALEALDREECIACELVRASPARPRQSRVARALLALRAAWCG